MTGEPTTATEKDASRQYDVLLFGATGYTGKLCAEYIHTKLPSDLRWAIAGRSLDKLTSVLDMLKSYDSSIALPAIEVCGLEADQVRKLAQKAQVVISTVGPYQNYGETMFQACAQTGTHYLDCTGETPWILEMIAKYEATAQGTGAIMIPSCGFDSVPSDMSAFVVVDHIRTKYSSHTAKVDCSLHEIRGSVSGGTVRSVINAFDLYSLSDLFKKMAPFSLSPRHPAQRHPRQKFSFSANIFGLRYVSGLGWMGVNPQGLIDRCYVNRSWGLIADSEPGTYGGNFDFHAWVRMPGPVRAIFWHFSLVIAMMMLCVPPIRWLVTRFCFKPGDGPTESFRQQCSFEYRTSAIADNMQGQQVVGRLKFSGDPYVFTALCLGEVALLLSRDTGTLARLQGGGILTTALLGSRFLDSLQENGVEVEIKEVV
ncbi:Saccharopine dehydrogenase-domain-containing protein [Dactylonectria estremocensis]|uniref:Saccharopine dehydrogenase-domain-containing protein n=1 Tax=Dactylonectria estremocensis TaxID=1079267 RepID=A0A9P9EMG6_9HYPO|nr:Saccharopine dehydrogenase-domain-containing protein [Dactylonectria estremocensis]